MLPVSAIRQHLLPGAPRQRAPKALQYASMRRADGLYDITRRDMFMLAGCVGLAIAGCTDGDTGAIETGPLGTGGNGTGPDAGTNKPPPDGGGSGSGTMATCGTGAIDVGAPSSFVTNTPVYNSTGRFFVVRDAGGLFAVTARCTHEGAICAVSGSDYRCPRHGALFTFDGTIISGPVVTPLQHYAMCTLANGHVGVDTTKTVAKSARLVA